MMLQGAYDSNSKLMRDTCAVKARPLETPYQAPAVPETGSKTMASAILNTSGNDAPVDWVFVELRDPTTPTTVKARLTGLVQRDGDMVDAQTGENTFLLLGVEPGNYCFSPSPQPSGGDGRNRPCAGGTPVMVDFSQASTATGDNARVMAAGTALLWAGNTNGDAQIISQGPTNDSGSVLSNVLMTPDNSAYTTNYKLGGYLATDTNMDGISIFAGPSNDVDLLLGNVLLHPVNSTFSSNYIIRQQLP